MATNQSSSPASRRGTEGRQSVSPASELGLEDKASVPFRGGGGGGGGRKRPPSSGAAAAAEKAAREKAAREEAARFAEAKRRTATASAKAKADLERLKRIRAETKQKFPGTISAAEKKRGLERIDELIRKKRRSLIGKDTAGQQFVGIGLGLGSSLLGATRFAAEAGSRPIQTIKKIPSGIKQTGKFVRGGGLARVLREEPGFAVGAVAGEILITKGGQVAIVRGGRATGSIATRLGPRFKKVRTIKTKAGLERVIKNLKKIGGKGELRIIRSGTGPKKVKGKATLPSIRGGFGFSKREQRAIIRAKAKGPTVSAAKGLFGIIRKRKIKIQPGTEQKKLGFFGTPPVKGIGFVRESRLGLGQKAGRFRDLISGKVTVGKVKPQIIVVPGSKGFKGTGFKSSELETTLRPGLILKKTGRAGNTVLGKGLGQRVPIFTAKVVKAPKKVQLIFNKATKNKKLTLKEKKTLKKTTGFTAKEISRSFIPKRRVSPGSLAAQISRIRGRPTTRVTISTRPRPRPRPRRPIPRRPIPRRPIPRRPIPRRPIPRRPIPRRPIPRRPIPRRPPGRPPVRPPIRPIPRRPPPIIPQNVKELLRKIKKKKRKLTKSDIVLVEGFTARALRLKPVRITKKNLRQQIKRFQTIGTRRRPVFVKTKSRRKRR